ncbi:PaaI family thioesterase [Aestuariibius insulae]|uniref:PaaI family thioesterase n=1 Tax=Aestuariibius insulae TaxID=2058287 RepID=UPI00345E71F0
MTIRMDKAALTEFLKTAFPQVHGDFQIDAVRSNSVTVRLLTAERHLRPGGTVSGPSMFALADVSIYLAILSRIGPRALAVTTNCTIDFMRKPAAAAEMICEARLLKLGRVLAVGDAMLFSDGMTEPVARAGLTYSIPPGAAI